MLSRRSLVLGGLGSLSLAVAPGTASAAGLSLTTPYLVSATSRNQLVLGVDDPATPGNSGLIESSEARGPKRAVSLQQVDTNMTYSSVGTAAAPIVVANKQFNRKITITGKFYRFFNCWFRGEPVQASELITSYNANCEGIQFWDCLFEPQNPMWKTSANFGSHHTEYLRCEFRHLIDGIAHHNAGGNTGDQKVSIRQCWFHDCWYASPDPGASGGLPDNASHADACIQWRGGGGLYFGGNRASGTMSKELTTVGHQMPDNTGYDNAGSRVGSDANRMSVDAFISGQWRHVRGNKSFDWKRTAKNSNGTGNTIILPKTLLYPELQMLQTLSLFMFSPALGPLGAMTFEKNWLDGGWTGFNFNPTYASTQGQIKIINNRWGHPSRPPAFRLSPDATIIANPALPLTITGNTRLDTGAAFNQRKNGGTG